MTAQFEAKYRTKGNTLDDDYFNKRWKDIDLRLVALEEINKTVESVADQLLQIGLTNIDENLTPILAEAERNQQELQTLLAELQQAVSDGIDADDVSETADRNWVTTTTRDEISNTALGAIRDGVDAAYDTLSKLKDAMDTALESKAESSAVTAEITAAIDALKGDADSLLDTLGEISDALGDDPALILTKRVPQDSATGAAQLPTGDTSQRPGTPAAGMFRFNSETGAPELFGGELWNALTGLKSSQVFTSSGTWTKPDGVQRIVVVATAAGGGGAGKDDESERGGNGGGSAGATVIALLDVTSLTSVSVTIGAGGIGANAGDGTDGGNTSFGALLEAGRGLGGDEGYSASGSTGISGGNVITPGDINIPGGDSGGGGYQIESAGGFGGHGGASFWGGGGKGGRTTTNSSDGGAGEAPGSGGGGGNGTSGDGGDGADGIVWVLEF